MSFINTLKKYWYIVVSIVVVVTIASFVVSVIQDPEYKSSIQLLVIQKQENISDAYTATRSAETVAGILSNVIYTSTFFDQVINSGFEINKNTFSGDLEERKKEWEKAVNAQVIGDTGTLQIDVFDKNRNQAEQLAYAIAYVIINDGEQYHGAGSQIETKLIDAPITSDKIARPNILLNVIAGILLGIMTSMAVIFLLSERKPKEKYTAGLEVKTMPKIKTKDTKQVVKKEKAEMPLKKKKMLVNDQTTSFKVKERIATELKEYKKNVPEMVPDSISDSTKVDIDQKEEVLIPKDAPQKAVRSRLASGMDSIGEGNVVEEEPSKNDMIYTPDEVEDNYKKIEEDKYSPEKVEKWIKTGKFE